MKNTLYTVPDGFFEDTEKQILERTREISHHRKTLLMICPLVAGLMIAFMCISKPWKADNELTIASAQSSCDAETCDIFLEIFEY